MSRIVKVLFCVLSVIFIWGLYVIMIKDIRWDKEKERAIEAKVEADESVLLEVNQVEENNSEMIIKGWIIKYNSNVTSVKMILKEVGRTEAQIFKTTPVNSQELQRYISYLKLGETNYNGGFETTINLDELREDSCYEIFLYMSYEDEKKGVGGTIEECRKKIATRQYLYNGELYRYNPVRFVEPKFVDEQMQRVIESGVVCAYDLEKQVWIYLYENELYWIVDKELNDIFDKTKKIYFHLYTSDVTNLPEVRIKNGFDNQDFYFENQQVVYDAKGSYGVAKVSLDYAYPITNIRTGFFDVTSGDEFWKLEFQYPLEKK